MNLKTTILTVLLAITLMSRPALATDTIKICNTGDSEFALVVVRAPSAYLGLVAIKPSLKAGEVVSPGRCYVISESYTKAKYEFGFVRKNSSGELGYRLYGSSYSNDGLMKTLPSQHSVCVRLEGPTARDGDWDVLAQCPDQNWGTVKLAFETYVVNQNATNYTFDIESNRLDGLDGLMRSRPLSITPPATTSPPRYSDGTVFGIIPDAANLTVPVFREPDSSWRRQDTKALVPAAFSDAILTGDDHLTAEARSVQPVFRSIGTASLCRFDVRLRMADDGGSSALILTTPLLIGGDAVISSPGSTAVFLSKLDLRSVEVREARPCRLVVLRCKGGRSCAIQTTGTQTNAVQELVLPLQKFESGVANDELLDRLRMAFRGFSANSGPP